MSRGSGKVKAFYRNCLECNYTHSLTISKNKKRSRWCKCPVCGDFTSYLECDTIKMLNHISPLSEWNTDYQIAAGIAWANS